MIFIRPRGKYPVGPGCASCDRAWGLRTSDEDKVEPSAQVISLQGPARGGSYMEGSFSEWLSSERNGGWRDEAYCLCRSMLTGECIPIWVVDSDVRGKVRRYGILTEKNVSHPARQSFDALLVSQSHSALSHLLPCLVCR